MGAVTVRTSIRGWNFKPNEFAKGTGRLIRAKDSASILASTDNRLWEKQIHDFEFVEVELCAAMVNPGTVVDVPNKAVHLGADGVCIHGQSVRPCTCHPDDAPVPCQHRYAATECQAAAARLDDNPYPPGDVGTLTESGAPASYRVTVSGRPWPPPAAEIQVTDEMHAVGLAEYELCQDVTTIYRSMRPLEPMEHDWTMMLLARAERDAALAEVPFIKGGHYDPADSERYGCHLIWWPDELRPPFFEGDKGSRTLHMSCPTSGMPTYYDIGYDERRPITQAVLDSMESGIQRLSSERQKAREENQALCKLYCETTERNIELNGMIERQACALGNAANEIALLRQALAMKDARISELKSVLASTPVAFEDPDAKLEPTSNPFRDFAHDPRRMGP